MSVQFSRVVRRAVVTTSLLLLTGCATVSLDDNLRDSQQAVSRLSDTEVMLKRTAEDREHADALVEKLLKEELGPTEAVQVALANSPAFQSILAQNWADSAEAAQRGRIPNPIFNFERVALGSEVEIGRLLSFGLLDLITLPKRQRVAKNEVEIARISMTNDVIEEILDVKKAWVEAITTEQLKQYTEQVFESAEASAELALRMQKAGNFSRLDRARQQTFYSAAATQLAAAAHAATAAREGFGRKLGLTDEQANQLLLPDRLPDLPEDPLAAESVSDVAFNERLDVKLAQAQLRAAADSQGLGRITSFTDIEIGGRHDTIFDDGERANADGYEVDIELPLFDWGDLKREAMNARTLAAANQLDATMRSASSNLREAYSAYRTAFDVSMLYRDEILPLQEIMAEESVLLYNGMLIGVFELLADSRQQVSTVMGAIDASRQFWLAEAALQASIIGKPTMTSITAGSAGSDSGGGGH